MFLRKKKVNKAEGERTLVPLEISKILIVHSVSSLDAYLVNMNQRYSPSFSLYMCVCVFMLNIYINIFNLPQFSSQNILIEMIIFIYLLDSRKSLHSKQTFISMKRLIFLKRLICCSINLSFLLKWLIMCSTLKIFQVQHNQLLSLQNCQQIFLTQRIFSLLIS